MNELLVLGNCATQTADCEATNFILQFGQTTVLFDAGPGVVRQLYRAGMSVSEIDLIVITHSHADHALGLPYLLFSAFVERTQGKAGPDTIPVVALPQVYSGVMAAFSFCYPPGEYPMFKTENWACSETEVSEFEFGGIAIKTCPVSHAVPTIAVRFDGGGSSIVLSSDTVYDERLVALASGAKTLVHEAFGPAMTADLGHKMGHGVVEDAARTACETNVDSLILCHWLAVFNDKREILVKEASTVFDGEILAPAELERIRF